MTAYYNEIEPYAAQWLRNLINAGHIAPGDVDERDIREVGADDVRNYKQCHFFAGIGGWSFALRLAGWPDDQPVWTGSCPCQPFSLTGQRKGFADERHLWPVWQNLIYECKPAIVFGEQVASAVDWLALVRSDLEAMGYAVGGMPIEAASAGAYHKRDRFWFVAHATSEQVGTAGQSWQRGDVANTTSVSQRKPANEADAIAIGGQARAEFGGGSLEWIECADGKIRPTKPGICLLANGISARPSKLRAYGNAIVPQVAAEFIGACMP